MKLRLRYLGLILRQHCKYEEDWMLKHRQKFFYTLKAFWAVLWGREGMNDPADVIEVAYMDRYSTYSMDWGEGAEWSMIQVPHGIRGWTFDVGSTGYP